MSRIPILIHAMTSKLSRISTTVTPNECQSVLVFYLAILPSIVTGALNHAQRQTCLIVHTLLVHVVLSASAMSPRNCMCSHCMKLFVYPQAQKCSLPSNNAFSCCCGGSEVLV